MSIHRTLRRNGILVPAHILDERRRQKVAVEMARARINYRIFWSNACATHLLLIPSWPVVAVTWRAACDVIGTATI